MRIYLAAPLFSQMQRAWNRQLAEAIAAAAPGRWSLVLPQDFRTEGRFNDVRRYPELYHRCLAAILGCDVLLAVLDGPDVDSGTAFAMGVAAACGKTIVGLRTDYRPGADRGVNMMCAQACQYMVREFSFQEDPRVVAEAVVRRLQKIAEKQEEPAPDNTAAHDGQEASGARLP